MPCKQCIHEGCNKQSNFNILSKKKPEYCADHKLENMVNVKSKRCIHEGCQTLASFNVEGSKKLLYCGEHKLEGMINLKSKTCIREGCQTQSYFNVEGKASGLYCAAHKLDGMIDIKHKRCINEGCQTQPAFNILSKKKPEYCGVHKLEGMVNVISKICIHEGCQTQPYFNLEGEAKALYCAVHKTENMIDIKHKRCIHEACKKIPYFNLEGNTKGLYCATHKKKDMINVKSKTCKSDWCTIIVGKKYDGYCLHCYIHMFPDKPVARNYKTKEYSIVEYVTTKFLNLTWIADKTVNGGCSKRRHDLLLDLAYQVIIIEVDENQHTDYDCSCENKRIMELSQDLGHRPIVFIRFNPDDYVNNKKTITSCWASNKNGICIVKKSKQAEWRQRLEALENQINYWINPENKTNKTIEIIQLFYDI